MPIIPNPALTSDPDPSIMQEIRMAADPSSVQQYKTAKKASDKFEQELNQKYGDSYKALKGRTDDESRNARTLQVAVDKSYQPIYDLIQGIVKSHNLTDEMRAAELRRNPGLPGGLLSTTDSITKNYAAALLAPGDPTSNRPNSRPRAMKPAL